jgi:hypothetical protein
MMFCLLVGSPPRNRNTPLGNVLWKIGLGTLGWFTVVSFLSFSFSLTGTLPLSAFLNFMFTFGSIRVVFLLFNATCNDGGSIN